MLGHRFLCTQKLGTEMERQKIHSADRPWDLCQYPDYLLSRSSSLLAVTFPLCISKGITCPSPLCAYGQCGAKALSQPSRVQTGGLRNCTCTRCLYEFFKEEKMERRKKSDLHTFAGQVERALDLRVYPLPNLGMGDFVLEVGLGVSRTRSSYC